MRIGIDARALGWAGLGRYTRNLLNSLVTRAPKGMEFAVFAPRAFGREFGELRGVKFVPVTASYYSVREQTVFLASLLREKLDLTHFLHFNAPIFYRRPSVVTIHDLTRFFFPAQKHKGQLHQLAYETVFRSAINNSKKIITVSEHTRTDLIRYFPNVAGKTKTIYEGVDKTMFNSASTIYERLLRLAPCDGSQRHETRQNGLIAGGEAVSVLGKLGIEKPYLLFVGVWMTHKNLPRLLSAFKLVKASGFAGKLVITGKGETHHVDVPALIEGEEMSEAVVLPGKVADEDLPILYQNAESLILPSLYEGFGLPALEAMACGTPVVASEVSSIPEILGDAVVYFDPYSVNDMAEKITALLNNKQKQAELISRGNKQAQKFSWENCAMETLGVYQSVLKRS